MSNLFSIFDPSTSNSLELNWISSIFSMLIIPLNFWLIKSRLNKFLLMILMTIWKEFKIILTSKFNFLNSLFFTALLMIIFLNNFLGLYPYIFTSTSHMVFSLSLTIPLWLSLMMFGWLNNWNYMFSHMIPQGTPMLLMPFMVLIETISNIIRPGTLSIRLTANMIAGHLLLTLMSSSSTMSPFMLISILIILIQMILLILEFSVSIIQSYVFTILNTLYMKETNYEQIKS